MAPGNPSAAALRKSPHAGRFARLRAWARNFWERVSEGFELQELWRQFAAEARASYGLYSQDVDWEAVGRASRWKRPFHAARALFWALLMKLSPARRVLLLAALALLFLSLIGVQVGWPRQDLQARGIEGQGIAAILLFILLALELGDRVAMKRDLQIARDIQKWLVPAEPPAVPGVDVAFTTRPANTVAGDYYDAFLRNIPAAAGDSAAASSAAVREKLLVVVADVAGKSVPAALLMATFQASLRALAALPGSLDSVVAGLNRYCCAHSLEGRRFTTALLAELDPASGALTYINAGHNAPILRRASGRVERLETGGLPLGIEANAKYESGSMQLGHADVLVIFSDGLIEAVNEEGQEFSESRLLGSVGTLGSLRAGDVVKQLLAEVDRFVGTARQHDDVTCLVLRLD